jgi:hypothetical protein
VKGPYKSAYFEIDVDYAKTDMARVKELQQHLGVDYVYVLWAPATVSHGNSGWFLKHYLVTQIVAQLFESPGGKEVGRGQYAVRVDIRPIRSYRMTCAVWRWKWPRRPTP